MTISVGRMGREGPKPISEDRCGAAGQPACDSPVTVSADPLLFDLDLLGAVKDAVAKALLPPDGSPACDSPGSHAHACPRPTDGWTGG